MTKAQAEIELSLVKLGVADEHACLIAQDPALVIALMLAVDNGIDHGEAAAALCDVVIPALRERNVQRRKTSSTERR